MKLPGWLKGKGRSQDAPVPAQPDTPRRPVLTTDPRDAGGLTTLCPTYVIHPTGFEDLRHWRQMVAARHPEARLLASLDNLGQAGYTAFHALETHGLDATDTHDLSTLPQSCFEDGAHLGYLSTHEEFPLRLANFQAGRAKAPARDGKLSWVDPDQQVCVDQVNADPDAVVHGPGIVQAVPVACAADLIAAFPNGYFDGDMTPFDVHALATCLDEIGYELIASGASYLAFWGPAELDPATIARRSSIVAALYDRADIDALNASLAGARHLILRYTQ